MAGWTDITCDVAKAIKYITPFIIIMTYVYLKHKIFFDK